MKHILASNHAALKSATVKFGRSVLNVYYEAHLCSSFEFIDIKYYAVLEL